MANFSKSLKDILLIYWPRTGLGPSILGDYFKKIQAHSIKIAQKKSNYDTYATALSIVVKLTPIAGGTIATYLYRDESTKYIAFTIAACTLIMYITLLVIEGFLPKDLASLEINARSIAMENALNILACQVTLYSGIQRISNENNGVLIGKLSNKIDQQLTEAIQSKWNKLKDVTNPNRDNPDYWDTEVNVKNIPNEIYEKLTPIAEMIHEACTFVFGPAKYTVKIYLRTQHSIQVGIDLRNIEMLTSLVKYPRPVNSPNLSGGRSWVLCKGENSLVWDCLINYNSKVMCKKDEPKRRFDENQKYASIVFIKLPEGIGVLTIESSEESTFSSVTDVTEDVRQTLMIVTNALVREALNDI